MRRPIKRATKEKGYRSSVLDACANGLENSVPTKTFRKFVPIVQISFHAKYSERGMRYREFLEVIFHHFQAINQISCCSCGDEENHSVKWKQIRLHAQFSGKFGSSKVTMVKKVKYDKQNK